MSKIINFPMLLLSLITIAIAIYMFLPASPEKQGSTVNAIETAQLAVETPPSVIYNEDSSSSPLTVSSPRDVSPLENQEIEEQYPSEGEVMPPIPDGGDW